MVRITSCSIGLAWVWLQLVVSPCASSAEPGVFSTNSTGDVASDVSYGLSTQVFRAPTPARPSVFHPSFEFKVPKFLHTHPDDPQRHIGKGQPLQGTSWLNRPYHADWLVGSRFNTTSLANGIRQKNSLFGGYRVGQDFDHYWGREIELSFTRALIESDAGTQLGTNRDWGVTGSMLYYPWGDASWRPYARWGLGVEHMQFSNENGVGFNEFLFAMPVGGGMKYYVDRWLAVRLDVTDHIAFGAGGIDTAHQIAVTFGIEAHFGGPRRRYR